MTEPVLPVLSWQPTASCHPRMGHPVRLVVVHRWGVRYVDPAGEAASYHGVVSYFGNAENQVSAHVVFPGSALPGEATQMVAWSDYAFAEAAYNPIADEVESADAIWLGQDAWGMKVLARIVAKRLLVRKLPPVWSSSEGFCRHADLGVAGGGHTQCPTTDLGAWKVFTKLVQHEYQRGGFKPVWGR